MTNIRTRDQLLRNGDHRGQVIVEFTLILPLLIMMLILTIEYGNVLNQYLLTVQAVAEGNRLAASLRGLEIGSFATTSAHPHSTCTNQIGDPLPGCPNHERIFNMVTATLDRQSRSNILAFQSTLRSVASSTVPAKSVSIVATLSVPRLTLGPPFIYSIAMTGPYHFSR